MLDSTNSRDRRVGLATCYNETQNYNVPACCKFRALGEQQIKTRKSLKSIVDIVFYPC